MENQIQIVNRTPGSIKCDVYLFGENNGISVKNICHKNETDEEIIKRAILVHKIYAKSQNETVIL